MPSIMSYLWSSDPTQNHQKESQRGIPALWYHDRELYQLERRAIYSKRWLLVSHRLRFSKPGDYVRMTQAGFPFFLILSPTGSIQGFHNICRHRGFPLLHADSGNARILSCKYHGWSYSTKDGALAKAPYFDDLTDFDKAQNGLWPVHIHIDALGFVWINLEASEKPSISWDQQFAGVDTQERFSAFDFKSYHFDHTWSADGNFNWKTLADNYNECLHCKTTHPDTAGTFTIQTYKVYGENSHLQHKNAMTEDGTNAKILDPRSTFYFPNACMTVSPHFFYMMRCMPISATKVRMEFDVYRHNDASDEDFERMNQAFKRIISEDKWLCTLTQENLESGVYANGPLHPDHETGPLYFQKLVKEAVSEHRRLEERSGQKIWPAARQVLPQAENDMAFCSSLSCKSKAGTDW